MVHVENLKKNFGKLEVLKDISVDIAEGEVVVLLGPSGSGKSTFLRCLNQLEIATAGKILVDGNDVTDKHIDINKVRENIGMVFQHFNLFPHMTILENMSIAENKGKPFNLTRGVNKAHIDYYREMLAHLNLGLEDKMHTPVGALSGGQRQAVALLMATMTPIDFLILDEHTAALDPKTAEIIMQLTDQVVREKKVTTIMVTHNLRYAVEYGSRLLMMHEGKVILDKTGEEKKNVDTEEIMKIFNQISVECGN